MKIRALNLNIYKHKGADCSNKGITSKYDDLYIKCEHGPDEFDDDDLPENFCELKRGPLGHPQLVPVSLIKSGKWTMFGGCYADTCDSRFRDILKSYGFPEAPVAIHDRTETQTEYNMFSR